MASPSILTLSITNCVNCNCDPTNYITTQILCETDKKSLENIL